MGLKKKLPFFILSLFILSALPLPSIIKHLNAEKELLLNKENLNEKFTLLDNQISERKILQNKLLFCQNLVSEINNSHSTLLYKSHSSWIIQETINFVQGIITQENIGDIWLDTFSLNKAEQPLYNSSSNSYSKDLLLVISGRYLVRLDENIDDDQIQDALIELDRQKKENLTDYLSTIPHIDKIVKKTFSIEGKGDLFNRYFSHFEYEIKLKLK